MTNVRATNAQESHRNCSHWSAWKRASLVRIKTLSSGFAVTFTNFYKLILCCSMLLNKLFEIQIRLTWDYDRNSSAPSARRMKCHMGTWQWAVTEQMLSFRLSVNGHLASSNTHRRGQQTGPNFAQEAATHKRMEMYGQKSKQAPNLFGTIPTGEVHAARTIGRAMSSAAEVNLNKRAPTMELSDSPKQSFWLPCSTSHQLWNAV